MSEFLLCSLHLQPFLGLLHCSPISPIWCTANWCNREIYVKITKLWDTVINEFWHNLLIIFCFLSNGSYYFLLLDRTWFRSIRYDFGVERWCIRWPKLVNTHSIFFTSYPMSSIMVNTFKNFFAIRARFFSLFCMKCQVLLKATWKLKGFFTKCAIIWSIFDFLFTCFQIPWNVSLMFNVFRALSTDVFTILYNVTLIWLLMRASFQMPLTFCPPFGNCITASVFAQNLLCLI